MQIVIAAALLVATVVLILRAWRQFGALDVLRPQCSVSSSRPAEIAVIVPARNEACIIGPCLASLVAQSVPLRRLSVIVMDDGSEDGTGEIVGDVARRDAKVSRLENGALAAGWTGKRQSCCKGAQAASPAAEWLCFMDADMKAEPFLLESALSAARDAALLSVAPRHRLVSFAERLMIPCGLYLLGFRQNLSRLQSPASGDLAIAGQFMLIRRAAYEKVGGHAAVRGEICEDLELARLIKRSGGAVVLMDASRVLSTRMYDGWSTLWPGFAKNVIVMFGGPAPALATASAAAVLGWLIAAAALIDGVSCRQGSGEACPAFAFAAPAALAAFAFHIAGAVYLGIPFW